MRASCVAFCFFAIYISSSCYASTLAQRDGGGSIKYPTASLENVDSQSGNNYPTESSAEPKQAKNESSVTSNTPSQTKPKTTTPVGKPDEGASDYPTGNSYDDYPPQQAPSTPKGSSNMSTGQNQPWEKSDKPADKPTGTSGSPPQSMQCDAYIGGNTDRANCGPEGSKTYCTGGCTGGVVAKLCQLNESSSPSTEVCTIAFRESSATINICVNAAGSFSCKGPVSGALYCNGCSGCNGCSSSPGTNNTSGSWPATEPGPEPGTEEPSPSTSAPNATTTGTISGGDNPNPGAFLSPFNAFLTSAFTVVGGVLLL
ncbi:hypothetical protein CROQUDRAFT_345447 [Cronartium quercuum f. sp. fusiforme G11]|uniref:Secreted protein n=1 Tax=Cronartium quercuum f. sp. fusiforme G11 TaxID=708437 RepID=A0A9P6T6I0_9BASI|nr:hypothetical protein CROQUDRAFT_345447 [Cronartium quercuum f. sp. fusiforme G11]